MPQPEVWLWNRLKRRREQGYRFRRQHPVRGYFLDFACLDRMLAIEVDGGQHSEPVRADHDGLRDRILEREGFRVLRFWNSEVRHEIDRVMDVIVQALEARPSRRAGGVRPQTPSLAVTSPP
ncbi:endonuclease domain-containing protein [Phenylobacterium sp. J367]|nr:endonuclease domain-containing protein [Phenylobacterium sp. J367]